MDKRQRHIPDGLSPQLARPLLDPTLPVYFYCEVSNSVKNPPKISHLRQFDVRFHPSLCSLYEVSSLTYVNEKVSLVFTGLLGNEGKFELSKTLQLQNCVVNETPFLNMQHNLNSISHLVILICSSKYSNPHLLATNLPFPESSTDHVLGELHILSLGVKNQVQCFHCFIWR